MTAKQLTQGVSAEDWAKIAKLANITPEELQSKYEAAVAEHPNNLREISVTTSASQDNGNCVRRNFEISLFKIVGIEGYVEFCGTNERDWKATFNVCLTLAGSSVWCTTYTLSPENTSICFHPDLALVKADLCIGIVGSRHCFNIKGKACYWAFGWHCAEFNETLFCFG